MSLPAANYFSNAARTEGEAKTALEDQLKGIKQIPGAGVAEQALTLASDAILPAAGASGIIAVDTEAAAASDNLGIITQTNVEDNSLLILRNANAARVVVVKHNAGGTGQISLKSGGDFVLADPDRHWLMVKRTGTSYKEVARFPAADAAPLLAKTANYTTTAADRGQLIDCTSGSFTVTLLASATAGKGFEQAIRNSGTGVITIDPNGSETIDGATALLLPPGVFCQIVSDGTNWKLLQYSLGPRLSDLDGHCRLVYTSATVLTLQRQNGSTLPVKTGGIWQARELPSAGITLGTGGLSASTLYYVYCYDSSGTLTLEASATAPTADSDTGVQIKTADTSRTLVGMLYTNGSTQFADSATSRTVLSYYNRKNLYGQNAFTAQRTTSSTTFAELNTEIRITFLTWADEAVVVGTIGTSSSNTSTTPVITGIGIDSATVASFSTGSFGGAGTASPLAAAMSAPTSLAVGNHYITVLGKTATGIAAWESSDSSALSALKLNVMVRG